VSKHIVEQAKEQQQAIALEDLTGIRDRTNRKIRKSRRGMHNTWSFYQLRAYIEYKAARAGIEVIPVNPAWTSQMCSNCWHIGSRSGVHFRCSNCGAELHADVNGAVNIATVGAAVVTRPEYSPLQCPLPQRAAEAAG